MKRDIESQALKPQLKSIKEPEDEGPYCALERIPVSKNDHGNANPSSTPNHINQEHVLVGQSQKGPSDPHQCAADNQTERSGQDHTYPDRVGDYRILSNSLIFKPIFVL